MMVSAQVGLHRLSVCVHSGGDLVQGLEGTGRRRKIFFAVPQIAKFGGDGGGLTVSWN